MEKKIKSYLRNSGDNLSRCPAKCEPIEDYQPVHLPSLVSFPWAHQNMKHVTTFCGLLQCMGLGLKDYDQIVSAIHEISA